MFPNNCSPHLPVVYCLQNPLFLRVGGIVNMMNFSPVVRLHSMKKAKGFCSTLRSQISLVLSSSKGRFFWVGLASSGKPFGSGPCVKPKIWSITESLLLPEEVSCCVLRGILTAGSSPADTWQENRDLNHTTVQINTANNLRDYGNGSFSPQASGGKCIWPHFDFSLQTQQKA